MTENNSLKAISGTPILSLPAESLPNGATKRSVSPSQIVTTKEQLQNEKNENVRSAGDLELVAAYSTDSILTSLGNIFRSMAANSDGSKDTNSSFSSSVSFYFYHSVLIFFYLFMSVVRLYEYSVNKVKLRFFNLAYNPSRTPSLINSDVNKLSKIPYHISTILNYKPEQEENGGVEGLCNDAAEVVVWCLSSGIPVLSIYEYHGILKKHVPELRRAFDRRLVSYFGTDNVPTFTIKIPHLNLSYHGSFDGEYDDLDLEKTDIEISLLSVVDGRATIVELTKVMSDLSKNNELSEKDIKLKFIDQELQQLVGKEPDLIVLFQPFLNLQGYPPWHTRLSEMYWEPDNEDVTYAVFLRALQKYSTCKVNVGR